MGQDGMMKEVFEYQYRAMKLKGMTIMKKIMAVFVTMTLCFASTESKAATTACQLAQAGYWVEFSLRTCLKKADEGDVFSQFMLGNMYYVGKTLKRDLYQSLKYYVQAANNKHVNSYRQLAGMYYKGDVVPQDYAKAYELYAGVDFFGDVRGKGNMKRLEELFLKGDELEKAKEMARAHVEKLKAGEKAIAWPLPFLADKMAAEKDK